MHTRFMHAGLSPSAGEAGKENATYTLQLPVPSLASFASSPHVGLEKIMQKPEGAWRAKVEVTVTVTDLEWGWLRFGGVVGRCVHESTMR